MGRGNLTMETLAQIHTCMCSEIEKAGGRIDKIYFAPDLPEAPTQRRKPGPGMLLEALAEFGATPAHSPMVGDMLRDMEAALAAGCPRILTRSGKGAALADAVPAHVAPVTVVNDLYEAAEHICEAYR
jgi:D-glycero-D-manno-heptose 1,7-bisphosphate phosphatase